MTRRSTRGDELKPAAMSVNSKIAALAVPGVALQSFLAVCLFAKIERGMSPSQTAGSPIHKLMVEGNSRLPSEGILAASGLRTSQIPLPSDFEAAVNLLASSGLFQSVKYRYKPSNSPEGKGYEVTIQVEEITQLQPVRLDIPGIKESQLLE